MNRLRWASVLALVLAASGCGQRMGQVEGKLVWKDGSPAKELENAQVVFESAELKTSARGQVGPDGGFTLSTNKPGDGCPVGKFEVAVLEHRPSAEGARQLPAKLDERFADLKSSGLTVEVKPGKNVVTLKVERAPKQ